LNMGRTTAQHLLRQQFSVLVTARRTRHDIEQTARLLRVAAAAERLCRIV